MIYILSFWSDIGFSIKQALRTLTGRIAATLYGYIINLYNVFMYTARAEILTDEFIQGIYNKVGLILGIFMAFKLTFSLIQSLIDPNKLSDEKTGFGGIIKRSVISIVLLGITPSLFDMAFSFQNMIVGTSNSTDNIIYKIIVGESPSKDAETFGHVIAADLYFGFYKEAYEGALNEGVTIEYPDSGGVEIVKHDYKYLKESIVNGNLQFSDTVDYLSMTNSGKYVIVWDEIFAIGMAIAMIWILVSYCIQVATRVIQLAYLQLIAPVPILSYISDPEGSFKRWTQQCLTTYLDLFIRLAIIYFVITVSTQILEAVSDVDSVLFISTGLSKDSDELFWVSLFLILGLLMFGKKVPDLLKDLFPNLGGGAASIGFGLKKPKDLPGYGLAKGVATFGAGAAIGGIAGMASGLRHGERLRGKLAGFGGGFFRGAASARTKGNIFKNASKGMANVRAANQRAYEKHHDGSSFWGRKAPVHAERKAADFERELELYKNYNSVNDALDKELDKDASVQFEMNKLEQLKRTGTITEVLKDSRGNVIRDRSGNALTRTRAINANDIQRANDKIKAARERALENKISSGDAKISNFMQNLEAIRVAGVESGYEGFSNASLTDGSASARVSARKANKDSVVREDNNIQGAGGSRHEEYKRAKANAKYQRNGN